MGIAACVSCPGVAERFGVWTSHAAGEEGRKDLWAPNLHQGGSGMSNREVGLLPPSIGVSALGNALWKVRGATLCHLTDVLVHIFDDWGSSSCVALW